MTTALTPKNEETLKEIAEPQFHPELTQIKKLDPSEMVKDELFDDAVRVVEEAQRGSVSLLQRRLAIGLGPHEALAWGEVVRTMRVHRVDEQEVRPLVVVVEPRRCPVGPGVAVGEIAVVVIAALSAYALLKSRSERGDP